MIQNRRSKNEKILSKENKDFFTYYYEYLRYYGLSNSATQIENLVDMDNIGGWLVHAYTFSVPEKYDWRSNLSQITAPTLVIYADKDICTEDGIGDYSKNIRNVECVKLSNCGHFPYEEKPVEFAKAIDSFLKK